MSLCGYVAVWVMLATAFEKQSSGLELYSHNTVEISLDSLKNKRFKLIRRNQR